METNRIEPLKRIVKTTLGELPDGLRLLDFLSARFTYHSRELWTELILEGRVLLDGVPGKPESILIPRMCLEYLPREKPEPEVDEQVAILLDTPDYLVLNKSGNLPCHPAGCFFRHTLWAMLKEGRIPNLAPMDEIHLVSRLDRETSGVILIARNAPAARHAARQNLQKEYLVLVEGNFPESIDASGWLYHDPASRVSKRRSFAWEKPALPCEDCRTEFQAIEYRNGLTLVQARLHTGRLHQIRATLRSLGFPVVGDKIYGRDETIFLRFLDGSMTPQDRQLLCLPRQALHAHSLMLNGTRITAPLPEDFQWKTT